MMLGMMVELLAVFVSASCPVIRWKRGGSRIENLGATDLGGVQQMTH